MCGRGVVANGRVGWSDEDQRRRQLRHSQRRGPADVQTRYQLKHRPDGVEGQLTDLRLLTSYLENELNVIRQENADFRRDIMTSALRGQSTLAADDVNRLMDKIVELMNGTNVRSPLTRHTAAGLPRGKPTVMGLGH